MEPSSPPPSSSFEGSEQPSSSKKQENLIVSKIATLEQEESSPHRVLALYKFVNPLLTEDSLPSLQKEIESTCRQYSCRGTLLLAREGINGTICYPFPPQSCSSSDNDRVELNHDENEKDPDDPILQYIQTKFVDPRVRISKVDRPIFARLKIKLKSEIVTMRQQDTCCPTKPGKHIPPKQWNELLHDPDCLVIDTRNDYEINVGTFRNAINPHTTSFTEFPDWMERNIKSQEQQQQQQQQEGQGDSDNEKKQPKKIAMFCTGGIRCEKATNACMKLVPPNIPVYHLEGGILAYLDEIQPSESLFDGECYVFDQRIAVTYGNEPSKKYKASCHACRHPLSQQDLQHSDFVEGLSCRYCAGNLSQKQLDRFAQRQRQIELAKSKGIQHIHDPKEKKIAA